MGIDSEFKNRVLAITNCFRCDMAVDDVLVWNDQKNEPETVSVSDTRILVEIDADETTKQKYWDHIKNLQIEVDRLNKIQEQKVIKVGSIVKVVYGRKIKLGTIGRVVAIRDMPEYRTISVTIETKNNERHKTYLKNLKVSYENDFVDYENGSIKHYFHFKAI